MCANVLEFPKRNNNNPADSLVPIDNKKSAITKNMFNTIWKNKIQWRKDYKTTNKEQINNSKQRTNTSEQWNGQRQ